MCYAIASKIAAEDLHHTTIGDHTADDNPRDGDGASYSQDRSFYANLNSSSVFPRCAQDVCRLMHYAFVCSLARSELFLVQFESPTTRRVLYSRIQFHHTF